MIRLHQLITALIAAVLLLPACGGQQATEVPEPTELTEVPAADVPESEATEVATEEHMAASLEGFPVTVEDRLGREFTFDAPPERIVCFYNGCMRGLGALGYPVAFPEESDLNIEFTDAEYYPGFAENVTVLARPGGDIDAEAVAEFQPDLIIAYSEDEITSFEAIAPVFAEYDPDTVDGVIESFINYGRIVGMESEAQSLAQRVLDRLEAYKMLSPNDVNFMTVGNEGDVLWLRTQNSSECQVLEELAQCDWPDPTDGTSWSYEGTTEAILNLNPNVIYMANWSGDDSATDELLDAFINDPLIAESNAAQNGRIYNIAGYDNPTGQGIMAMTKLLNIYMPLLYPDIFPDGPLTDEEVQKIIGGEAAVFLEGGPVIIEDSLGRELTFDKPPTRFYSYGNRDIEILAALGIEPVGVADVSYLKSMIQNPVYFPQPVETVPVPNGEDWQPDIETLLAMDLDVAFGDEELVTAVQNTNLDVYAFYANGGPSNWREGIKELRNLATLTGREEQAERIIQEFEDHLAAYKAVSPGDRSVMLVGVSEDEYYISTEISGRCNLILEVATCPWPDPTGGESWSYATSAEGILNLDPDFIILDNWGDWSDEQMNAALTSDPLWNELSAVKAGRVTPILGDYAYVQGIGPIGNMQWLDLYMPLIYPETFPDGPLTDEQVRAILAEQ